MEKTKKLFKDWKFHLSILFVCIIAELIGPLKFTLSKTVSISLLPLLYTMVIVAVLYLFKPFKLIGPENNEVGSIMLSLTTVILMARLGASVGTSINAIVKSSFPLIMSNVADSMTAIIALPVALLLGFNRETIGMAFANSREPGLGIIENKYGNHSEFRGVVSTYIVGTVFGTITIGLVTSLFLSTKMFSLDAVAMAAGIGSASMSSAAIGALVTQYPDMNDKVSAFVTASNLISTALAVYVGIFINLPLTEWMYKKLYPILSKEGRAARKAGKSHVTEQKGEGVSINVNDIIEERDLVDTEAKEVEVTTKSGTKEVKLKKDRKVTLDEFGTWASGLLMAILLGAVGNYIFTRQQVPFLAAIPGLFILFGAALIGLCVTKWMPGNLPAMVYVSLIMVFLTIPQSPTSAFVNPLIDKVKLLSVVTPILAYAGVTIGRDWKAFKKIGWRGVIVGVVVIFSAYFWGAVIAEICIRIQNLF